MGTLSLNITMYGKPVVIIGGGSVAHRKLVTLLDTGALLTVVAPEMSAGILALGNRTSLTLRVKNFDASDLDGAFLVIAATSNAAVNAEVGDAARRRNTLIAMTDDPSRGDCTFPALLTRKELRVAVSTGGRCPTFAAQVRDIIGELIGEEYGDMVEQLANEREKLLTNGSPSTYNRKVLQLLATQLLCRQTEQKDTLT